MTVFIQLMTYGSLKAYEIAATIKRKSILHTRITMVCGQKGTDPGHSLFTLAG